MPILILFLIVLLIGCQSEDTNSIISKQSSQVKGVKQSDFVRLDGFNENFNKEYMGEDEVNVFKGAFGKAELGKESIKKYDYDIEIELSDGTSRALHLTKNGNGNIMLKYIGDSTDIYVIDKQYTKELIDLIY